MPALADLFKRCYLTGGSGVEFSAIRLHYRGVDDICRAFGATALTVGTDIYFRREAFAPHTPEGLRLLAHEVAHVVQQHRRPVTAGPAEEREADAAADALLRGRRFDFGAAGNPSPPDLHSGCAPSALHQVGVSRTLGGGGHAAADLHAGVRRRSSPGCAAP